MVSYAVYGYKRRTSQFHYGSIKTEIEIGKLLDELRSLNSTMVRLKRTNNHKQKERIKLWSQFHYGSIKTIYHPS